MSIDLKNITFRYPKNASFILRNVCCNIPCAGFHGLFGPSGVGKTTLANIIAGRLKGFSGSIDLHGMKNVLFSYNMERLPGWGTVRKHLLDAADNYSKEKAFELIEIFGLNKCLDLKFTSLSLGQQNRVNLSRYLMQNFDILIMDECLANVDERTRQQIIMKIKEMFPDKTFIYISHNMTEVVSFCRQIIVLREAHKQPQAVITAGIDITGAKEAERKLIDDAMMEVVRVS